MSDQQLFIETLPNNTHKLVMMLEEIKPNFLSNFYLSGGTALSLQLGHRESEDLDFFTEEPFDPRLVLTELEKLGKLTGVEIAQDTLNGYINGVKIQFLGYPYPLIEGTVDYGAIKLSSVMDIACTKLQTIGMRGSKKDFVDVYVLLTLFTLQEIINAMGKKYINSEYSLPHILKSLVYFVDAETQVMPRLHQDISWDKVKEKMIKTVKSFRDIS